MTAMILACPQGSFDTHLTLSHSPNRRKMNYDEQQYLSRIGRKLALSLLLSTFETGRVSIGPICAVKFRILLGRSAREVNVELLSLEEDQLQAAHVDSCGVESS